MLVHDSEPGHLVAVTKCAGTVVSFTHLTHTFYLLKLLLFVLCIQRASRLPSILLSHFHLYQPPDHVFIIVLDAMLCPESSFFPSYHVQGALGWCVYLVKTPLDLCDLNLVSISVCKLLAYAAVS